MMDFFQDPPRLAADQYADDRVLRSYLARVLDPDVLAEVEPSLSRMGCLAGGPLFELQAADRLNEPVLTRYDAWGNRVDRIELTPLWQLAARVAAEEGVVATAYERRHGAASRIHQFALAYLFEASSDVYTCPLAMTDGAAKSLVAHGNQVLLDRALPRLTDRDPATAWTSGQWMTERIGGSDVGLSETVARPAEGGAVGPVAGVPLYRLRGTKWFTSATTSQMALALARPEGNPDGGRGLALFYVEIKDGQGRSNGITVHRLKDKLGTRKVPTAELTLDGTVAVAVAGLTDGVRNISPMLNVTRVWNAVGAAGGMRRGLALARDYAARRVQFGAPLSEKPLHLDTLAGVQAEYEAAFHLTFRVVELLGAEEAGEADEASLRLLRLLTPIVKLTTGRQAVAAASEILEAFGGAGYVEDTGLPRLLRDAQVLPIWEGTTNVLSLDTIRAIVKDGSLPILVDEVEASVGQATDEALVELGHQALSSARRAAIWLAGKSDEPDLAEAGARRFALTLGRSLALARLVGHAQWALDHESDERPALAARRFAAHGIDRLRDEPLEASRILAGDLPASAAATAGS